MYRLFDQGSKEKNLITLGTSPPFTVKISDMEVTSNLKFCFEAFADKSYMKAVTQVRYGTVRLLMHCDYMNAAQYGAHAKFIFTSMLILMSCGNVWYRSPCSVPSGAWEGGLRD